MRKFRCSQCLDSWIMSNKIEGLYCARCKMMAKEVPYDVKIELERTLTRIRAERQDLLTRIRQLKCQVKLLDDHEQRTVQKLSNQLDMFKEMETKFPD